MDFIRRYFGQVGETAALVDAEAFQAVIWHCLVSHPGLRRQKIKW
jgi:hypothetical protein